MALQKQVQSIPFVEGPDQKTDPKLSIKPAVLNNSVFRGGSVAKRWGRYTLSDTGLTNQQSHTDPLTDGSALFTLDGQLLRLGQGGITSALTNDGWLQLESQASYCTTQKTQLIRSPKTQYHYDVAVSNGVGLVAWVESVGTRQGLNIAVFDVETGTFYQNTYLWAGVAAVPRCLAFKNTLVVIWMDPANTRLRASYINIATPSTAPVSNAAIVTNVYADARTFDAFVNNDNYALFAYPTSGTDVGIGAISPTATILVSPGTNLFGIAGAAGLKSGLYFQKDSSGYVYIVYGDTSDTSTYFLVLNSSLGAVVGKTAIVTGINWDAGNANMAVAAGLELVANQLTIIMSPVRNLTTPNSWIGKVVLGHAGIVTAFADLPSTQGMWVQTDFTSFRSSYVFGAVNLPTDPTAYVEVIGPQMSAYVLATDGTVVARGLASSSGLATDASAQYYRVSRAYTQNAVASIPFSEQGRFEGTQTTPLGISLLSVFPSSPGQLPIVQVGRTVYIGGGFPRTYDGSVMTESGFSVYPVNSSLTIAVPAGGLSTGTYQYCWVWSWLNAQGELIRSIVTPPSSIAVTAGQSVSLPMYTMPESMRDLIPQGGTVNAGATVVLEVYRTEADGTVFYRQSSVTTPTLNATAYATTTGGTIAIVDSTSDADLISGEILYTTGGILDWEAPPPYFAACAHQGRLIALPSEDRFSWAPSSEWTPGENVRFSATTVNYVPADAGPLVNCASMDGKLILFAERGAYLIIGDGPDNLGLNNYPPPQRIASVESGPLPNTPIVETPMGLLYQSGQGLILLDRGLNTAFIGADVVDYSTGQWTLKSALLDTDAQQIRLLLDTGSDLPGSLSPISPITSQGGVSLVYDYFYKQWSLFPGYGGQGACFYQGRYTMVSQSGAVWQEAPGTFLDDGESYSSVSETPWIKLAGLQGFQRIWYVTLLGTYGSDCTIRWEVAYSYDSSPPDVANFTQTVTLDGTGVYELGGPLQLRHHVGQKCAAIKFRFTDLDIVGSGEGIALSDLSLEFGVKGGVYRLSAAKTV